MEEEVAASPQQAEAEEVPAPLPSTSKMRQRTTKLCKNTTATPEQSESNREKEMMDRRFREKREQLLDLQIKHMAAKLAEAEERKEEARFRKAIAKKEFEQLK